MTIDVDALFDLDQAIISWQKEVLGSCSEEEMRVHRLRQRQYELEMRDHKAPPAGTEDEHCQVWSALSELAAIGMMALRHRDTERRAPAHPAEQCKKMWRDLKAAAELTRAAIRASDLMYSQTAGDNVREILSMTTGLLQKAAEMFALNANKAVEPMKP